MRRARPLSELMAEYRAKAAVRGLPVEPVKIIREGTDRDALRIAAAVSTRAPSFCAVCEDPADRVTGSTLTTETFAACEACVEEGAEPLPVLVAAMQREPLMAYEPPFRRALKATLRRLDMTDDEFLEAVAEELPC